MAESRKFQNPEEVKLPAELDGWEEMYPSQRLFSKDREEWEKRHFWFQDKIHAPEPLYPFDDIFQDVLLDLAEAILFDRQGDKRASDKWTKVMGQGGKLEGLMDSDYFAENEDRRMGLEEIDHSPWD